VEDPLENEEALLKITEDGASDTVVDKVTFRFADNTLSYSREVNPAFKDAEVEHAVKETQLAPLFDQTWSETFLYGWGNRLI